jgi:hypothetical protein
MSSLLFVHSDAAQADSIAEAYRGRGWSTVVSSAQASDALQQVSAAQPVAAVFCLEGECVDDVQSLAAQVVSDPACGNPLMVFIDGAPDDVLRARAVAPYGIFVSAEELPWVLKRLVVKM